ncbi:hypothetical protein BJX61DRAFT_537576 [Aspergillus egyptiacus]|nr:hypothetical protein BJX61DRAFT_537576 [Aspergillus egyptiacus]
MEGSPQASPLGRGCPPLTECCASSTLSSSGVQPMPGIVLQDNSDAIKYLGVRHLLSVARRQYDSLQKLETSQQIVKFQPVTEKDLNILSADDTRPCKFVQLHYHRPTELWIVKVLPEWDHENMAALIRRMIDRQLMAMNVILRDWIIEPDQCWAPAAAASKPTCVIEIGTSESAVHLSADARGWLKAPQSPVQAVVTICLQYLCAETDDNPFTISVWRPGNPLSTVQTRNGIRPAQRTACVDIWNIAGSVRVSIDEIRLPLEVFGRQAVNTGEHDIVITKDMLLGLLPQFWEFRRQRRTSELS